ncbi:MAG: hypothetical protein U0401_22735 [Anaerolineae bacterium]
MAHLRPVERQPVNIANAWNARSGGQPLQPKSALLEPAWLTCRRMAASEAS